MGITGALHVVFPPPPFRLSAGSRNAPATHVQQIQFWRAANTSAPSTPACRRTLLVGARGLEHEPAIIMRRPLPRRLVATILLIPVISLPAVRRVGTIYGGTMQGNFPAPVPRALQHVLLRRMCGCRPRPLTRPSETLLARAASVRRNECCPRSFPARCPLSRVAGSSMIRRRPGPGRLQ